MKTLIQNTNIVSSKEIFLGNVLVENEKIVKISKLEKEEKLSPLEAQEADLVIDGSRKHLLPGMIDPHVHFRDPGFLHKEDFCSGSRAAIAGGVTTVFDMPNTEPPTFTRQNLEEKRKIAQEKSFCNFAFFIGAGSDNLEELQNCRNIAGIKIFMNLTTGNLLIKNDKVLEEIAKIKGKVFAFHAEGDTFAKAVNIFSKNHCPIYLCHVSLAHELEIIRKLKNENYPVFAEITPHHLFLKKSLEETKKGFVMMKPLLSADKDRKSLWEAMQEGFFDTLGSDHAPHTLDEKNTDNPPFGVPGVETSLPLLLSEAKKGAISLEYLVRINSENPANIFKVKNKGFIKEGFDADLVLVDLAQKQKIVNENIFSKCSWTPYHNFEVSGKIEKTWVNGKLIFDKGKIMDEDFRGKEVEFF